MVRLRIGEKKRMTWSDIRIHYPGQWLLVEAIDARSEAGKRIIDDLSVVERYSDSATAMRDYQKRHRESPQRELLVLHTDREDLDISERRWLGVRGA